MGTMNATRHIPRKGKILPRPWNDQSLYQTMNAIRSILAGAPVDVRNLCNQCLLLSKIIDSLVANNVTPHWRKDLLPLVKQICKFKDSPDARPALTLLLLSVKNAFRMEWLSILQASENDEIFATLKLLFESFTVSNDGVGQLPPPILQCGGSAVNSTQEATVFLSTISHRFYPRLQISAIFVAVDAKAGYEVLMCDFHVPHMKIDERVRLYVVQKDTTESAVCLITPPLVNFLVNGRQIEKRVTVGYLDGGPQMPTDVTRLVKVGANVLQVIGEFAGSCVIAIASARSINVTSKNTPLVDYLPPTRSASELGSPMVDDEVVEGASRVSLRCPVSHQRLMTPVKATTCRHLQCFDYDSFLEINEKRPAWRCPCCNRCITWPDIRIDRQMEKVLKEADEKVIEVIISQNGSWVPVNTGDDGIGGAVLEGDQSAVDMIDLSLEEESDTIKNNNNDFGPPDRKPDKQTLEAIAGFRSEQSSQTTIASVQRETSGAERNGLSRPPEISNIPDITVHHYMMGSSGLTRMGSSRPDGLFQSVTGAVAPSVRALNPERQRYCQIAPLSSVVQGLPASNNAPHLTQSHSRGGHHSNSLGTSVNTLTSSGGYTATPLQHLQTGLPTSTGRDFQEIQGGHMRHSQWHPQVGHQAAGVSQNAQDLGQARHQRSGTPLHQQIPNATQQQFIGNQGHASYPQHQFQIPASNPQQFPARTGSSAGLQSGNLLTGQVLAGGAVTDRTWRPTGRMRGSISPTAVGVLGQQPSPIPQSGVPGGQPAVNPTQRAPGGQPAVNPAQRAPGGQPAVNLTQRVPGGIPAVNPTPLAAPGYNTINNNVSPALIVNQPFAGQYHRVLQGNPRAAETFYIAGKWVTASAISTPVAPMFQGVNTSEGWMNFDVQRPGPPS